MGAAHRIHNQEAGFSRRGFLAGTAAVAAIAVVPVVGSAAFTQAGATGLLRQTFTPLLHQAFQIVNPAGGSTTVTLTAIRDLSPEASPGSNFRFSLLFEGSAAGALPQGTYQVTTRAGSAYTLLVVPVTQPTHNKVQYQVIVNNPG